MPKHIFIIIRYSVLMPTKTGTVIARDSNDLRDYSARLFAPDRLAERLHLFKNITLESIRHQHPCDARIHTLVLTSDVLPSEELGKLSDALKKLDNGHTTSNILFVPSVLPPQMEAIRFDALGQTCENHITGFLTTLNEECSFATVRLDDDDALASSFCSHLSNHLGRISGGLAVTFPYGVEGFYDCSSMTFQDLRLWHHPKIALGLSFINQFSPKSGYADERVHVYNLGRHTRIDGKSPMLSDSTFLAYFRTLSNYNDSGSNKLHQFLPFLRKNDFDRAEFPFLKEFSVPDWPDHPNDTDWTPSLASSERARTRAFQHEASRLLEQTESLRSDKANGSLWAKIFRLR